MKRQCLLGAIGLALFIAMPAAAQNNKCADCHFANPDAPGHLAAWNQSLHGENFVGCETCHGGHADTFEKLQAHRDMLPSQHPASPVHPVNVASTCGKCHVGSLGEFQKSPHYRLVRAGNQNAATCTTCHGSVEARRMLSVEAVDRQCSTCHGPGKVARATNRVAQSIELFRTVQLAQSDLDRARHLLGDVKDKERREQLKEQYRQAEVNVTLAADAAHSLIARDVTDRLADARRSTDALFVAIADATPRSGDQPVATTGRSRR